MTEYETRILNVVRAVSRVKDANPSADESLFDSGILDSFGLPDLIAALEAEFNVSIPDSDLKPGHFASLQAITAYLRGRASGVA